MQARSHAIPSLALLFGAAVLLSGCNDQSVASSLPQEPAEVSIVTVKASPRAIVKELPGRIAPLRVADVRPRVSGIIIERMFEQGSAVKAGEALYQIDPKPLEAALGWLRDSSDADGDGFAEYFDTSGHGLSNQGWKDSGDSVRFADGTIAEVHSGALSADKFRTMLAKVT